MCTYSAVMHDWMNPLGPNYIPLPGIWPPGAPKELLPNPFIWPNTVPAIPPLTIPYDPKLNTFTPITIDVTPEIAKEMLEILKRVDALDKKLGMKDCRVDENLKKVYTNGLRKIANKGCACKAKAKKKKAKKAAAKKVLLRE